MDAIYLNYNDGCPMEEAVRYEMYIAMENLWHNPRNRRAGSACRDAIETARGRVAAMICAAAEDVVFTSSASEANNWIVSFALNEYQRYVDSIEFRPWDEVENVPHIITTTIESRSILDVLDKLEAKRLCRVTKIPVDRIRGSIPEFAVIAAIRRNTCLISISWANSETGVIQPVVEVSQLLREYSKSRDSSLPKVRLHTDAAHAAGHIRIDLDEAEGIDFVTIGGQMIYGPPIGALYARNRRRYDQRMFDCGQGCVRRESEDTMNIVGFGKAAEMVTTQFDTITVVMKNCRDFLESRLKETFPYEIYVYFSSVRRLQNTACVAFRRVPTATALLNGCRGLIAGAGDNAPSGARNRPSPSLVSSGISENMAMRTVQFSVGRHTTIAEVERAVIMLREAVDAMTDDEEAPM